MGYKNKQREEVAPHIYAVSDLAFRNMLEEHENQSILVTGESGAGKTENTKKVIQYLAAITTSNPQSLTRFTDRASLVEEKPLATFEQQILQANPILEAFGNAQTVRNNNSSRFGKFIRIEFGRSGQIAGASIDWYLLEKSRVIYQNKKERNYHIFYQLLEGLSNEFKEDLLLSSDPNHYTYLRDSNKSINGVNDLQEFKSLVESFRIMGFTSEEQGEIFKVMSAILHIGNIELGSERSNQARIVNSAQAESVCHLLGINAGEFMKGLLRPRVKAGREWVHQSRSAVQVKNSLDALAKTLYEKTFGAIVDRINQTLERGSDNTSFIGVLDIAGFEIFDHNSFEQLCINYTNEKLQQFFNHHMFVLEQEEYSRENIEWRYIDFGHDLQPTIDLIEKTNPIGIFSCLDEDCVMPKATDESFTDKLNTLWSNKSDKYKKSRLSQGFILTHYAAEVEYSTDGWLEKNKDPLNDNVTQLLVESTESYICKLFAQEAVPEGTKMAKKGLFRTVAQRHKEQLNHLMNQLNSTHPHFVRCILPNHTKQPRKFDNHLVLDQLRCNGVLEGIRIARTGYPNRLFFAEFRQRYGVLVPKLSSGYMEGQKACQLILQNLKLDESLYKVGLTKLFFKSGVLADLEEKREAMVRDLIVKFQTIARGYLQRSKVKRSLYKAQAASIIKKNFEIFLQIKDNPWWKQYVKIKPLLVVSEDSGGSMAQELVIKKLTDTVKVIESEKSAAVDDHKRAEQKLKSLEETLESERMLALDKEEILKRSQEREYDLEEQLTGALEDLDDLEVQCEELLLAKKRVDSQAEVFRTELENGAVIIQHLEQEKSKLRQKLVELEEENAKSTSNQAKKLEEFERLSEELNALKHELSEKNELISELEEKVAERDEDIQTKIEGVNNRLLELSMENSEQKEELDELYKSSSEYEGLIRRKEEELVKIKATLSLQAVELTETQQLLHNTQEKFEKLTLELQSAQKELKTLKTRYVELEHDEKEARSLLQAKVSDDVKNDESRKILSRKISELENQLKKEEEASSIERKTLSEKLVSKQSQIDKLTREKDKVLDSLKDLSVIKNEKEQLIIELDQAKTQNMHNVSLKKDIAGLKLKLGECEEARDENIKALKDTKSKMADAVSHSKKLRSELDLVSTEKIQLTKQISQLKQFIDDDLANKEKIILEKNKIFEDLENTKVELRNVKFEHNKLTKELSKKGDHLRKLRSSFTDEATTQRTRLNKERADLEVLEKTLRQDLEKARLETATVKKQKEKMSQEIDDLKHDISSSRKTASQIERQKASLEEQLHVVQTKYDKEHKERTLLETEKRRMKSQIISLERDIESKNSQPKPLKSTHARNRSMDITSTGSAVSAFELARKLEEAEKKLKKSEETRVVLEKQLRDKSKSDYTLTSPNSRSMLDEIRSSQPPSPGNKRNSIHPTNGIRSTIDSLYGGKVSSKSPRRVVHSRSSYFDGKENSDHLSIIDSVKSLDIPNKSVEEIEDLLTNYESSKRDLMSVFQDTSRKLLETKDLLAESEEEISRLHKALEQGRPQSMVSESENETLVSTISDLELRLDAEIAMNQDLANSLKLYKTRAEDYYGKLESAETIVLKATRAEDFAKSQWKEAEGTLAKVLKENKEQEGKMIHMQSQIQLLEDKLEDTSIDLTHANEAHKRVTRELQDLKDRRKQDATDLEKSLATMRERYKNEISSISEELTEEKNRVGELQTENRHLQHELEMLKVRSNMDTLDPSWGKFKVQLEDKVQELTKANEQAVLSHQDSQRRVASLLAQVRTLRTTMEEISANRDQLQEEKKILENRLSQVSQQLEDLVQAPGVQTTFGSHDELSKLQSSVRQKTLESTTALEKLRTIEEEKLEVQKQLQYERGRMQEVVEERSILDKENKSLHLKVVDLEAQLLGVQNSDSNFLVNKVNELEHQLDEQAMKFAEESRTFRSNDRSVKDLQTQLIQKDKLASKLQEELDHNESKIRTLQETVENLQALETSLRLSSRRAEREVRDLKENSVRLEKDLEDWRNRYQAVSSKRNSRAFGTADKV